MTKINEEILRDKAYLIATGNHLTHSFDYNQFQHVITEDYMWEPFDHWPASELEAHIAQIAEDIFKALKEAVNGAMVRY